jgi:predicted permease
MPARLFKLLLRLYPRAFRQQYGQELVEFFQDERRHRRYRIPVLGTMWFWTRTMWDLMRAAIRMRAGTPSGAPRLQIKTENRRTAFVDTLWQDVKYAWRGMLKTPGFSVVVIVTLALGIGANAAIFSVLNNVVLRPLPYQDPEGLVFVWEQNYQRDVETNVVSPANYFAWQEQNEAFAELGAISEMSATITGDRGPERIGMVYLSSSILTMLGARTQLGRLLTAEDERPESAPVVLLSFGFWQRRFGSNPNVLGQTIILNGSTCEVVGVLQRGFDFEVPVTFNAAGSRDAWIPTQFDENARTARGRWLQVLARLENGVSLERAQNHMTTLASRLEQQFPEAQSGWTVKLVPLHTQIVGDVRTPLFVLLGSVGFVLLIACANVANLLLARATGRQREIAVRSALGAGRARVVRQLLTESFLLALAGGVAGLLLAFTAVQALMVLNPQDIPRLDEISLDYAVVVFTIGITLLTGLLFGALPAFRMSGLQLKDGLAESGERGGTGHRHNRIRSGLVIAEFALSMVLLVGAGLLVRSFARLLDVDVGFDTGNIITAQIALPARDYSEPGQRVRFFEALVERVQRLPGVSAASAITFMPLTGPGSATSFWVNDRPMPADGEKPVADLRWVHRDFHQSLGVPLISGRLFGPEDTQDAPLYVIISETTARELWPLEDAVGKTVSMPWGDTLVAEVIGVVGDVRHDGPTTDMRSKFYWDFRQFNVFNQMTIFARTQSDPASLSSSIRQTVAETDANLPVYNIRTVQSYYSEILAQDRLTMLALGLFAMVALLLAGVGIYGVMSYSVNERRREIGIRMALGARASSVTLQVFRSGIKLVGVAVLLGVAGSFALSQVMSGMLFGVAAGDPITLVAVTVVLSTVALAACYLPARRASRVCPMETLRQE